MTRKDVLKGGAAVIGIGLLGRFFAPHAGAAAPDGKYIGMDLAAPGQPDYTRCITIKRIEGMPDKVDGCVDMDRFFKEYGPFDGADSFRDAVNRLARDFKRAMAKDPDSVIKSLDSFHNVW